MCSLQGTSASLKNWKYRQEQPNWKVCTCLHIVYSMLRATGDEPTVPTPSEMEIDLHVFFAFVKNIDSESKTTDWQTKQALFFKTQAATFFSFHRSNPWLVSSWSTIYHASENVEQYDCQSQALSEVIRETWQDLWDFSFCMACNEAKQQRAGASFLGCRLILWFTGEQRALC